MKVLSGSNLKILAIITMIIDHVGVVFFPGQYIFRIIGRLAFPIYAFLLVEGMLHTRNISKYLFRLLIFGMISEIPYDLAFSNRIMEFSNWNIMFTLFIGGLAIAFLIRWGYTPYTCILICLLIAIAQLTNVDGGGYGVIVIILLFHFRDNAVYMLSMMIVIYGVILGWLYKYAILAMGPIYCYNGKRGYEIKWIGYWIYPIHLLILAIIRDYIR